MFLLNSEKKKRWNKRLPISEILLLNSLLLQVLLAYRLRERI
jgi:hypothetical protein